VTVSAATRALVLKRSMGYCEVGGELLTDAVAIHHRKLRSQLGHDEPSNLLAVCHDHHNLGDDAIHLNVAKALENGWLLASWQTPLEAQALIHGRWWVHLDDAGRYHLPPPTLAEIIDQMRGKEMP